MNKLLIDNSDLITEAEHAARNNNGRIKRWRWASNSFEFKNKGHYIVKNMGRYSSKVTYNKFDYFPIYTSFIAFNKFGKKIIYKYGWKGEENKKLIKAPAGMFFTFDDLGAKLVRRSDEMEYHFDWQDLTSNNFATRVRSKMAENYKKRAEQNKINKQNKIFERVFNKEIGSTYVKLEDSRRAGNCVAGALEFAEQKLKLDRNKIINNIYFAIPAKMLLRTKDNRAINSVRQAFMRETMVSI